MVKNIAIVSLVVSILAIPLALVSGIGVIISLLALSIAGITAYLQEIRYSVFTFFITTFTVFGFSLLDVNLHGWRNEIPISFVIPYLFYIICFILGFSRLQNKQATS